MTGMAAPNAAIEILNEAGDVVGSGNADENGNYTITLSGEDVSPEESLNVVAIITAGGKDYRSNATPIVVPVENTIDQTATPIIEPVTAGDTTITGTAVPGAMVTVTVTGESITVKLMRNGEKYAEKIVKADKEGNWTYGFDNLPKYDAEGKEYTYAIQEEKVSGYTTKVNGYDLVNTYRNTETTEVAGTKTWDDYDNKFNTRPESITVKLMRNDKEIDDQIVKADHQGNWTYRFDNLPKYDAEGKAYTYAIQEEKVSGYTTKVNGYDLVNTYRNTETTEVAGTKTWDDYSNKFNTRPESITVELMQNGKEIDKQVVKADKEGNWIYRFDNLPKYDEKGQAYTYSIQE